MTRPMASQLANGHILVQQRLRAAIVRATGLTWASLEKYNEADVDEWLRRVVPIVQAGQRQAVAATDAYLARALERQPLGVDAEDIIANARNGATADEVYRRPFVDVWGGLKEGRPWADAVGLGLDRATSAAAMDMQLAMRGAARDIGVADSGIFGYERVPNGGACEFCLIASTQRYHTEDLMPLHNRCGCSVEPLTSESERVINQDLYKELGSSGAIDAQSAESSARRLETRAAQNRERAKETRDELAKETDRDRRERLSLRAQNWDARAQSQETAAAADRATASGKRVAVKEHGELGPVLVDPNHDFAAL